MKMLKRKAMPAGQLVAFVLLAVILPVGPAFKGGRSGWRPQDMIVIFLIIGLVVASVLIIYVVRDYLRSQKPFIAIDDKEIRIDTKAIGRPYTYKISDILSMRVYDEGVRGSIRVELVSGHKDFIQFQEAYSGEEIINFVRRNSSVRIDEWHD